MEKELINREEYDERVIGTMFAGCKLMLHFKKQDDEEIEDGVLMPLIEFLDREYLEDSDENHVSFK